MAILHKTFVYIFGFCNVVVVEYTQKSYEFDVAVWGGKGFLGRLRFNRHSQSGSRNGKSS